MKARNKTQHEHDSSVIAKVINRHASAVDN